MPASQIILPLFQEFEQKCIRYACLRGFENLPHYSNDIDIAVHPFDGNQAINLIQRFCTDKELKLKVNLTRLGVTRLKLSESPSPLPLDVWFDFNLVGLRYIDIISALESKTKTNGIYTLNNEYEFSLSLLKELLHNSRIREDKLEHLQRLASKSSLKILKDYFSDKLSKRILSLVKSDGPNIKKTATQARIQLFVSNIVKHGMRNTITSLTRAIRLRNSGKPNLSAALNVTHSYKGR